ncbi:hypothetical protein MCHIJ_15190 [Mycolicibacterium chitae]|uniref:Uncharacterized protein n=1 Tax=Mycolicibacterium chitae TaxID=1792 RepID=A0A448IF44_MYCCI|nr:hypothetical protein MCHIJ_15190 [Mycolicibacterium chitae]VEG50897.1 Uncharacterised protein [Mycolicibacterium chitae]
MPKPPRHTVALDRGADGLADDQTDQGTSGTGGIAATMNNEIRLCGSYSLLDRRAELG